MCEMLFQDKRDEEWFEILVQDKRGRGCCLDIIYES